MGLRAHILERSAKDGLLTLGLILVAVGLHVFFPHADSRRGFAEQELEQPMQQLSVAGDPIYVAGDRAVLFFDTRGAQGPIRGVVVVEGDKIAKVDVFYSREGIDRTALLSTGLLESFQGRSAEHTVVVDAVSGATISSRHLIAQVNRELRRWQRHVKRSRKVAK